MPLSYVHYISDGVQDTFPLTFPYLDQSHVKVFVDKSAWNFVIDEQYKRVKLSPIPEPNRRVSIRRHTPKDKTYSNFSGGNPFGQVNVNNNFLWLLYISQENAEGGLSESFIADYDMSMGNNRITNLGAPVDLDDALRYRDLLDFPFKGEKGDKGDKGDEGPMGPRGPQGIQGIEGPQGALGATPNHEWEGTRLRLQQGDGTWGNFSDLIGPEGPQGPQGVIGPVPKHEWRDTSLRFQQGDGSWGLFSNLIGPQGATGPTGPQGAVGPTPAHQWEGSKLRFQQGDGTWGNFEDLVGPEGPVGQEGPQGNIGATPNHKWVGNSLQFQQGDGEWGNLQDLTGPVGPVGQTGPQGVAGPSPAHEWSGKLLRFKQPNGSWGNFEDVSGPQGARGEQGIQGPVGVQGPVGPRGLQGIEGPQGPRGDKGDKGDDGTSFKIDAIGTYAERSQYDSKPALFTFMATDYQFGSDADVLADTIKTVAGQAAYTTRFTSINVGGLVVTVGGSVQSPTRYDIDGGVITFKVAPTISGMDIIVRRIMTDGGSVGAIFFKNSNTVADWSVPVPFGRGPEGPKGIQGDRGERGPQGPIGPQGPQGDQGLRGPTGNQGPAGVQGLRGPEGPKGVQGEVGLTGPQGPAGPQGPRGPEGPKGVQGGVGLTGPQGPTGPQGARGPEGPKGVQGDKGLDGAQGPQGLQGLRGPEGPKGVQGERGITGPQGPQGPRGPEGQKGVQGDKGIDGQQGPQGNTGPQGPQGPVGNQGPIGPAGPIGPVGPVGPRGAQGDKGPNGQAGERGSRAFYEAVSAVSWNQGIVDRFFGPNAQYPYAVPYDLFIQYNEGKGYSETRIYRNGTWQVKPVNLVQDFINKITNGVSSTNLQYGKVTEALDINIPHRQANDYDYTTESSQVYLSGTTAISGQITPYFHVKGNGAKMIHISCRVTEIGTGRVMTASTKSLNIEGLPYEGVLGYVPIYTTFPINATLLQSQGGSVNFKLDYSITSDENTRLAKFRFGGSGTNKLLGIKTIA